MNITELQVTGYDGAAILFTACLTADDATLIRPGSTSDGDSIDGQSLQKATQVFTTVRNLIKDIANTPDQACLPPQ